MDPVDDLRTVLMFAPAFAPIASPGTHRPLRFAKYLPEFGWRAAVVMIAPETLQGPPVDPTLKIPPHTIVETARIRRPLQFVRKTATGWLRGNTKKSHEHVTSPDVTSTERRRSRLEELQTLLCATPDQYVGWILPAVRAGLRLCRQYKPRALYSTGPPHSSHLAALIVKRLTGIPTVIDLRDPWARNPLHVKERGRMRTVCHTQLEQWCVRNAEKVILNTCSVCDDFISNYKNEEPGKFCLIPNGFDPDLAEQVSELTTIRTTNGKIRLCHPGALFGPRDLGPCITAIKRLRDSGLPAFLDQVGRVQDSRKLFNSDTDPPSSIGVKLHGHLKHAQTLEIMAASDILVVLQAGTGVQVPSKLYEMLLFRKPILALAEPGATADFVREFQLGPIADPSDSGAIADAIREIIGRSPQNLELGRWSEACKLHDGRMLTGKLAGHLSQVTHLNNPTNQKNADR